MNGLANNPVTLRMFARQDARLAGVRVPDAAYHAMSAVHLNGRREITDPATFIRGLSHENPAVRRAVLAGFNDRMQMFGDRVCGRNTVSLSSESLFPDLQKTGIITAVKLTDQMRQFIDTRWTAFYEIRDYRQRSNPYFEITDVYHNISVDEYQPGERIKIGFVEAEEAIYKARIYGVALQWSQLWEQWQDDWSRADGMTAMQTKWANKQAQLAYDTITGAALPTTAYDTAGADALAKDTNTINAATLAIRSALFDATSTIGSTVLEEEFNETTPFYLLYDDQTAGFRERINAALAVRYEVVQGSSSVAIREINNPIIPIASPRVTAGFWYIGVPKRKNVFANFGDLRFYDHLDPRVAGISEAEIGWGYYRFVVDDVNAWRKVSAS